MNRAVVVVLTLMGLAGCESPQQTLDKGQATAVETAVSRGRFEMACPEATGQVLSREIVQPALNAPRLAGVERAEYTVGVQGCGKRTTQVVICAVDGTGCFAAEGRR